MNFEELFWRRVLVCAGGLIYWGGVLIQGRRIRKRIKRSPNLKPRDPRERVIWAGWMLVILLWIFQPLFADPSAGFVGVRINPELLHPLGLAGGVALTLAGYAATLWCYVIMGNAWRIGIDRKEKNELVTTGPYRWIRHPIYAFQTVMLLGGVLLVPTICSGFIVVLHLIFVFIKARDEEAYLVTVHGEAYRDLMARTGRLLPKLRKEVRR
jgi:protein-S-isoprenylcysteine O-methyltransferase Ste14